MGKLKQLHTGIEDPFFDWYQDQADKYEIPTAQLVRRVLKDYARRCGFDAPRDHPPALPTQD